VTTAAGLTLALASAFALNWGWLAQHSAASELPPLTLRSPIRSLRSLFRNRAWLAGFLAGVGGWVLYVSALALAPLSLVQATSAGGIGLLALLVHRRGDRLSRGQWLAVALAVVGLLLLAVSLAGGAAGGRAPAPGALVGWLAASAVLALVAAAAPVPIAPGAGLGIAAGLLYAAGDVATKPVVYGGLWLVLVPILLCAHGGAFVAIQLGFQRAGALATAGTASLLTNAVPIAAGVILFHEHLPAGPLGDLRVLAFVLVVVAAGLLARPEGEPGPVLPVPFSEAATGA
jgi:hypothetical protein